MDNELEFKVLSWKPAVSQNLLPKISWIRANSLQGVGRQKHAAQ